MAATHRPTYATRPWQWLAAAAAGALILTGCGAGEDPQTVSARGIVLNLGGRIGILDGIDAPVKIAAERPAGAEPTEDVFTLSGQSQLPTGEIVGVDDGALVAIDPASPERAVVLGPAVAWFASHQRHNAWAVTEEPAQTACAGQDLPESVTARYTVRQYALSGRPGPVGSALPCGIRPLADGGRGMIGLLTTADDSSLGNAKKARTDVVLLDPGTHQTSRTLAKDVTIVSAGGARVLWRQPDCGKADCITVYDTTAGKGQPLPDCDTGVPAGRGVVSADGRRYATALTTQGHNHLAVLDLGEGRCKDLGPQASLTGTDLDGPFKAAWSQANLLTLDTGP
ncbi:hypothetical protein [Streptomyces sp. NPDC006879]|uniref:hypothetical protein n=1 Tax=Streptomyces sp. NPDC006879 TaxID=3364767 RepID=UPI0036BD76FD